MTQENEKQDAIELLETYSAARSEYLEKKQLFLDVSERLSKHKKSAADARDESELLGKQWRTELRENHGDLTKEIQKLRSGANASAELAAEYDLIVSEVGIQFELLRLDLHSLRSRYMVTHGLARSVYAAAAREDAFDALVATPEWNAFAAELVRSDLLPVAEGQGVELIDELFRLVKSVSHDLPEPELSDAWHLLDLEPLSVTELLPEPLHSPVARTRMRESLLSRQRQN